jgi:hypothetical protein
MMKIMITSLVLMMGALHIGWNKDEDFEVIPVGYAYELVGNDGKRTLAFETWHDVGPGDVKGAPVPMFRVDKNGHVTMNVIDPAIGWGE